MTYYSSGSGLNEDYTTGCDPYPYADGHGYSSSIGNGFGDGMFVGDGHGGGDHYEDIYTIMEKYPVELIQYWKGKS